MLSNCALLNIVIMVSLRNSPMICVNAAINTVVILTSLLRSTKVQSQICKNPRIKTSRNCANTYVTKIQSIKLI